MPESEDPPYAFTGLDRVFHERARLGIVTSLAGQPGGLQFADLRSLCGLTDGNLNRHLATLEQAGFLVVTKGAARGRRATTCRLTEFGRERFIAYLAALEDALREGTRATAAMALRPGTT